MLKPVGNVINLDCITLAHAKAQFALVCVTIVTQKPLSGSLWINCPIKSLEVYLNYEGMNEVCPLCGSSNHSLDACPRKIHYDLHLIVERLNASNLNSHTAESSINLQPIESHGRWIKVTPKKPLRDPS